MTSDWSGPFSKPLTLKIEFLCGHPLPKSRVPPFNAPDTNSQDTIRHRIIARTFFCFENCFPAKARNVTHKITPALLTNSSREVVCLDVIVLRNKAHETSASRIARSWVTRPKCIAELIWSKLHAKMPRIIH